MAAEILSDLSRATDSNANALSGAKWYFYATGTTTPQAVYSDAGLVTPLSNPVVADSGGQFVSIYFDATLQYRGVLKTSGGTTLKDIDPINTGVMTVLSGSGGSNAIGFVQSGTGAVLRTLQDKSRDVWNAADFGVLPSASAADNVTNLRQALVQLSAAGGGELRINQGTYNLASATLSTTGLTLPANVVVRGAGREATKLVVTGTTKCIVFRATNVGNLTVRDLWMYGNSQSTGEGEGEAVRVDLTSAASAHIEGVNLLNLRLDNFMAPYWISIENVGNGSGGGAANTTGAYAIRGVRIEGIRATGYSGNSIDPNSITQHAHVMKVSGYSGLVEDVRIADVRVEATWIKGAITISHQVVDWLIDKATVTNAGLSGAANDKAAYAIEVYDTYSACQRGEVRNARITAPRSCGIYVAGGRDITVTNAVITGQTDTVNGTLPKAAVVFNGTIRPTVRGGYLSGNAMDLHISPTSTAGQTRVGGLVEGLTTEGSPVSIVVKYTPALADVYDIRVVNNSIKALSTGIQVQPHTNYRLHDVVIEGNRIEVAGTDFAVDFYVDSGSSSGGAVIKRNTIRAANIAVRVKDQTGSVVVADNDCRVTTASGQVVIQAYGCTSLTFERNNARDSTSGGTAFDLRNSTGTMADNRAINCANVAIALSLGLAAPTHSGGAGHEVQNLGVTAAATPGWICTGGTTWKARAAVAA